MRAVLGRGFGLVVVAGASLAVAACSDDEGSGGTPMADSGVDSGAMGGTGGMGGSGGTGGSGGGGGTDAAVATTPTEFECGTNMCTVPDLGLGDLGGATPALPGLDPAALAGMGVMGCCTEDDQCGVMSDTLLNGAGCLEQDVPGEPDPGCPSIQSTMDVMGLLTINADLPGCCQDASAMCGIDFSAVTLDLGPLGALLGGGDIVIDLGPGCVELSEAAMIMNPNSTVSDAGTTEPLACGAGDGGADDGGS